MALYFDDTEVHEIIFAFLRKQNMENHSVKQGFVVVSLQFVLEKELIVIKVRIVFRYIILKFILPV